MPKVSVRTYSLYSQDAVALLGTIGGARPKALIEDQGKK
jgi:hypothetical protein